MKSQKWLSILLITGFFSGCNPSNEAIQTAIAQTIVVSTETANKVIFDTQKTTSAPTALPKPTRTLEPTTTPTPSPSPTPDIRIVDTDPQKLLCKTTDLPPEGKYYLPDASWTSINTNEEVISNRGVEKGRDYVISTGRITGWWIERKRGTRAASQPEQLGCSVYLFKNKEGAILALNKFNSSVSFPENHTKALYNSIDLGDENVILSNYKIDSGGDKNTDITIEFSYKNLLIMVNGSAKVEEDVPINTLVSIGRLMLERIKAESLVAPEDAYFLNK
jgi:hypothetical protein